MSEQKGLWKKESNNNSLLIFKITFSIFISPQMEVFILFSAAAAPVCLACALRNNCLLCECVLIIVFGNGFFDVFLFFELHPWRLCVTAVNDAATATATAILKNNTTNECMSLRKSNKKARDKGLSITMYYNINAMEFCVTLT